MKPFLPALALAVSICLMPSASRAELPVTAQSEAASAYQALDALARQTRAQGELPRWTNPDHTAVLKRLWTVEATLGKPPYRAADVPALLTIADQAGAVYKTYLLFTPQPGMLPDTAANTARYQDEIARAAAYLLHVQAAEVEALADFITTLPPADINEARRDGIRQIRVGIVEQITGLTLMLRSPGLRAENRSLVLQGLGDTAGKLAAALPPDDRVAVATLIDTVSPGLSAPDQAQAVRIRSAFSEKTCAGLCAMTGR